ncbi:hypothetical protein RRSWK_00238 [Rhodopirellula sp. SWK7]|nr:hypothetical protein RRSWK_00238 [Rhodopirellula sp. SWK7]
MQDKHAMLNVARAERLPSELSLTARVECHVVEVAKNERNQLIRLIFPSLPFQER